MTPLRLDDLKAYSDVVWTRNGNPLTVRFVEPGDAGELQTYFRSLSAGSRYYRFLGGVSELASSVLDDFIHVGDRDRFSIVATLAIDGFETVVGEARYAFHADSDSIEFGLSIEDRSQGQGVGKALLGNLECRAAALGAARLFGDTLRSNDAMIGLARQSGFDFVTGDDWKLVRFEKLIGRTPQVIPCASWRLAADVAALSAATAA